jgi:hypothetical protein
MRRTAPDQAWQISKNTATLTVLTGNQVVPAFFVQTLDVPPVVFPYNALPGDFIISPPTDAQGNTTIQFSRLGLNGGDEVRIAILGVLIPINPAGPSFWLDSLFDCDLPTTPGEPTPTVPGNTQDRRGVTFVY